MNDFQANIPIYLQVVEKMKTQILNETLKAGDKLPSVRELALQEGINPNTIQRAYLELEREGFIRTERAVGKYVADNKELIERYKQSQINEIIHHFLQQMKDLGMNKEDIIMYLKKGEF